MPDHDVTIDEVVAAVSAVDPGVDTVVALVKTLKQQVLDALGHTITPAQQAALNSIFDLSTADAKKLADAAAATP